MNSNVYGTNANDVLTSTGNDTLTGYGGNDTYYSRSVNDLIVEALNGGTDSVFLQSLFDFDLATSYTLAANVERLGLSALNLTADPVFSTSNKLIVNGNALNNVISIGEHGSEMKILAGAGNDTITGGAGNDEIDGGLGSDLISGNAGKDTLYGGYDVVADILNGGTGNDTYILKDTKDIIVEVNDSSTNTIKLDGTFTEAALSLAERKKYNYTNSYISEIDASAVVKNLTLTGNATTSTAITGGAGNDTITGGTAVDRLAGGKGNDTYIVSNTNDTIVENLNEGLDTLKIINPTSAINLTLGANIENVDASTVSFNNILNGNAVMNSITGGKGNDTLFGGNDALVDTLTGGNGSDTYLICDARDTIAEAGTVVGNVDTVKLTANYDDDLTTATAAAYTLRNTKIEVLDGSLSTLDLTLIGNATTATRIIGGSGDDHLYGGSGNNTLIGGAGTDVLTGGAGNDTYVIDDVGSDTIVDAKGIDTVKLSSSWAIESVSSDSFANIENIDASDSSISVILSGNAVGKINNTLIGSKGSDILYGGEGADVLKGGKGSDTYFVANSTNSITENKDEGYDRVILNSSFNANTYTLGANIEFLDATNAIRGMTLTGLDKTSMTILGTFYNDKITGGTGDDTILSYSGNDTLYGGTGKDYLDGGDGADYIDGGAGDDEIHSGTDSYVDILAGGEGLDEYWISDTNDIIRDTSSAGNVIRLNTSFSENGFSLADNASEDYDYSAANITMIDAHFVGDHGLYLAGNNTTTKIVTKTAATATTKATTVITYEGKDILIYGTHLGDTIVGYAGDDTLWGGYGDATYYGGGDDVFYGGAGTNNFYGGLDNDTYIIDGLATSTTIVELPDGKDALGNDVNYGTTDTIKLIANNGALVAGIDYGELLTPGKFNGLDEYSISLASYANVEILDASLITETKLTLTASDLGSTIYGGSGDDSIKGGAKDDKLYGGDGNDTLSGGQGLNTLDGGNGDDTYNISIADEETIKDNGWVEGQLPPKMLTTINDSDGIDTIVLEGKSSYAPDYKESFSLTIPDDIDNLDASAISKDCRLNIVGNDLDNIITGGKGADTITSGKGDDTVYDYETYVSGGTTYWFDNLIDVGDGNNTVITGLGDDEITAGNGNNFIYDYDGNNVITIGNGKNRVYTGAGWDEITTGNGDDYIVSDDGDDIILSGAGNDTIDGGLGNDAISGEGGNDYIIGGGGNDSIFGGKGSDTIDGGDGANTFYFEAGDGKDLILSTNANDIIDISIGGATPTDDMLFYTDNQNNFYIDYTEGGVGTDVAEISADCYDDNTTIQIGSSTININTIIGQLTAETSGLDGTAILNLNTTVEANQAGILTWST